MKLAILLTATIQVQVVQGNFSTAERLEMYASTLRYYSKTIGRNYPIIFLENSGYDLSELKKEFHDSLDIEFIQFQPTGELPFDKSKGKSFNEYMMIGGGVNNSQKLLSCTHFMKITGRYAMLNINSIIAEVEKRLHDKAFMCDVKDTGLYEMIGSKNFGRWGDSRYWVASVDYYKNNMLDCYLEMNDSKWGMWAEDYILHMSRRYRQDPRFIFRFHTQVMFNGITGMRTSEDLASGKYRQDSISQRFKWLVKQCLRWTLPNIWF